MALAVFLWSPVIIITLIPAFLQSSTAFLALFLAGSIIPTSPVKIRFSSSGVSSLVLYANPIVLKALFVISLIFSDSVCLISGVIISILPLLSMWLHLDIIISGAPFEKIILFLSSHVYSVVIILRERSSGISLTRI